ncbi:hypothetical protein TIFTF001_019127 [Ficus carica]|uniref:CTLH domain-containing protein n=1 Tax=Ficus carica TaxID=3494 RepID=A0AA88D8L6_FICCA|nr:hypothetical protein TIFTF001_019127 [Ficus carica]
MSLPVAEYDSESSSIPAEGHLSARDSAPMNSTRDSRLSRTHVHLHLYDKSSENFGDICGFRIKNGAVKMSSLSRELVFLILQFLDEEKFKETVHKLEQESGFFFNMKYFEDEVHNGNWDEVEKYLSGFTKVDDNRYSMKIFFEIRKQKYLEALDKHDRSKAVDILVKDLKPSQSLNYCFLSNV